MDHRETLLAFNTNLRAFLERWRQDLFGTSNETTLRAHGFHDDDLEALHDLLRNPKAAARVALSFDGERDLWAYLLNVARFDLQHGTRVRRREALARAVRMSEPLTFEGGDERSLDPRREAQLDPARRTFKPTLADLEREVNRWASEDAEGDSAHLRARREATYRAAFEGLIERASSGAEPRTATGALSLPFTQADLARRVRSNEVYVRRWLRDLRDRLDDAKDRFG
jgi:hypothetical protein